MTDTTFPCTGKTDVWFSRQDADIDYARAACLTCPVAQRAQCARGALRKGDKYGVWAGVYLPGLEPRDRAELDVALERLRLIAGLDRCYRCWGWFAVAAPDAAAMDAALAVEVPPVHRYERLCPGCEAAAAEVPDGRADVSVGAGELVDLPPSSDPSVRRYWDCRARGRGAAEGDWLLIAPDGQVEGCYAWPVAAGTFGRTVERFRRMIAEGWTVRRATAADRNWNRLLDVSAAGSVSA